MNKLFSRFALLVLLLVLSTAVGTAAEYRVILKNGAWIRAQAKPTVENGKARIRLVPGQLTLVPADQVDWDASDRWNRAEQGTTSVAEPDQALRRQPTAGEHDGTVTMVREPVEGTRVQRAPDAAKPAAPTAAAPTAPPADPDVALRTRISALDKQLQELREQKKKLERQAGQSLRIEDSTRLRKQAADLGAQIQTLRGQQNSLILQLSNKNR